MSKFKWLPIFKIQLIKGCLLVFNNEYKQPKPYFFKSSFMKDFTFGFKNIEIQYRESAKVKYNCHICLYDPADCFKDIRRGDANKAMLECYSISMKDGNMVENK